MNQIITNSTGKRKTAVACVHLYSKTTTVNVKTQTDVSTDAVEHGSLGAEQAIPDSISISLNGKKVSSAEANNMRMFTPVKMFLTFSDDIEAIHKIRIETRGGGFSAQKDATQLALAKVLVKCFANLDEYKSAIKKKKMLTTDTRVVERNKPGRVKARKKQAFKKR